MTVLSENIGDYCLAKNFEVLNQVLIHHPKLFLWLLTFIHFSTDSGNEIKDNFAA